MRVASAVGSLGFRVVLGGALLAGMAARADAGCTINQDASLVRRSLNQSMSCADKRLRSGPTATCNITPPPACAATLVTDALAIAYGANNPPLAEVVDRTGLKDQLAARKRSGRRSRATSAASSRTS